MEKIDIHHSEKAYSDGLLVMKKQITPANAKLIEGYLDASAIGKTQRQRKQAGIRVRIRNMYLLKTISKFFNKPLNKLTEKDIEILIKSLNENKILKQNGDPYSDQVKANMKVVLISFLRWVLGDTPKFHKLTSWVDTRFKKKEIIELSESEVKKILNKCLTPRQKILIALLFDTGARIEELLNIRISDVIEVKGDIRYYRIRIREEFSKTQGRTVSLLWKPTTKILGEWLQEHPDKDNMDTPLIPATYDGVRKTLYKLGKKAIGRSVNPHLFRHSSATYYASKGTDYFQLCKRYGWVIGSDVPNRYIHKSGIKEKEIVEKFKKESVEDLEIEIENLRQQNIEMKDEMFSIRDQNKQMFKAIEKENQLNAESDNPKKELIEAKKQLAESKEMAMRLLKIEKQLREK